MKKRTRKNVVKRKKQNDYFSILALFELMGGGGEKIFSGGDYFTGVRGDPTRKMTKGPA